jgi:hypothetical protein
MSTLKSINIIHPSGSTNNIVNDSSGNIAVGGTMAMGSSFMRNRIINGAMVIDQRNAGAASANTINAYFLDRWAVYQSTSGKLIAQQNAGSVTPPAGFANYLGVTSQSAFSVASSDYYIIAQGIEGYNFFDFDWGTANAKTVTMSFWVRSSLTGSFGGTLRNGAANYSYPFTYTISSANTWEYKTITIAGPTSGTWIGATNALSVQVNFGLGVGSTLSGTAGSWSANNYLSATGATSVVGTNGATFYITGVQLEVGSVATPFEREIYSNTLAKCQRYYTKLGSDGGAFPSIGTGIVNSSSSIQGAVIRLPVTMRTQPTITFASMRVYDGAGASAISSISGTTAVSSGNAMAFDAACSPAVLTAFRPCVIQGDNTTAAFFAASAEL